MVLLSEADMNAKTRSNPVISRNWPDPSSGKVWMFFGSVGKMHRVELDAEGTAVAPGARYTLIQRICWGKDGWPYVEGGKPAIVAESPCLYK